MPPDPIGLNEDGAQPVAPRGHAHTCFPNLYEQAAIFKAEARFLGRLPYAPRSRSERMTQLAARNEEFRRFLGSLTVLRLHPSFAPFFIAPTLILWLILNDETSTTYKSPL